MKIEAGIVWEKRDDEWVKVQDNFPSNRRGAKMGYDDDQPWGDYHLSEAICKIEEAIQKNQTGRHYRLYIVPGKETTAEQKAAFTKLRTRKQVERGEIEPVESYVSD